VIDMKKKVTSAPKVGRPRSFDADQALEAAMLLFWRTGYEGTSLSELTHAMGVSAPSLYAAFGDKQQLFFAAAARYLGAAAPRGGAIGIGHSGVLIDDAATATDARLWAAFMAAHPVCEWRRRWSMPRCRRH
jgi:AcrR family transcriptional regulator